MSITRKRRLLVGLVIITAIAIPLRVYFVVTKPSPLPTLISPETRRIILSEFYGLFHGFPVVTSGSNILICVGKSNQVLAVEIDAVTGLKETNNSLSQFFQKGVTPSGGGPVFKISGSGNQLIEIYYSNGIAMTLGEYDLRRNLITSETCFQSSRGYYDLWWVPGSDHWGAMTFSSNSFDGLLGGGTPPKPISIPHAIRGEKNFDICGFDAVTNFVLLVVDNDNYEASKEAELITSISTGAAPSLVTNKIALPIESKPKTVKFSPSGKSLLWVLEKPSDTERTVVFSTSFPFVTIRKDDRSGNSSLWVSRSDGSHFKCLGEGVGGLSYGIQWCPGGKTILVPAGWCIYFIPVPPEFENSANIGNTNSGVAPVSR